MPPAVSRILTPAMVVEMGNAVSFTWRAQPPFCTRLGEMLKDDQKTGMPPTSVAGGFSKLGRLFASAVFCGPGSVNLPLVLIAPCGGESGFPNTPAACAATVAVITPPAVPAARILRRDIFDISTSNDWCRYFS